MTAYYTKNEVRAITMGSTSATTYDTFIDQEGPYADIEVENDLFAFADATPPFDGDDITNDIKSAANWATAQRVFSILGQGERAKQAYMKYLQIMGLRDKDGVKVVGTGGIIGRFKATPTSRTTTVSVTSDYRSEPLKDEE